ncbi:unnamed protein product, partial [Scytosiphon promiscuus]
MEDPASRRGSRVKKEAAPPGIALDSSIAGESGIHQQYAAAAAAALAKGSKRSNVAGFLAKAYQIFDNPAWSDICGWGQGGDTVVIRKQIDFAKHILPLFFNHSNLQSFVRQLNMYNFRKVVQDPNSGEFKHDLFRRGNEHALHKIKRKQSAAAAAGSNSRNFPDSNKYKVDGAVAGTAQIAGGIVHEAEKVLDELVELRKWKEDMENTVVVLKEEKQTLQGENQMLKGQVAQHGDQQLVLQNKMQKILYCMYDAYVSGLRGDAAAGSPALTENAQGGEANTTALAAAGHHGGGSAGDGG